VVGVGGVVITGYGSWRRAGGAVSCKLEVLSNNPTAMASYSKFGFKSYELDPALGTAQFMGEEVVSHRGRGGGWLRGEALFWLAAAEEEEEEEEREEEDDGDSGERRRREAYDDELTLSGFFL
jgi:hypothetical protein